MHRVSRTERQAPHTLHRVTRLLALTCILASCQTDGEYVEWTGRTTPVKAEFKYLADPAARFAVEYEGMELVDTIPYRTGMWGLNLVGRSTLYLREDQMKGLLRVYRLGNGERTLEMEERIAVSPMLIAGGGDWQYLYSPVNLAQFTAGGPIQLMQTPEAPADSSAIALQFFYGDERQPEEVTVSLLAVDQYSLIMKSYKLASVADEMKREVGEISLRSGELSETVTLNLNLFGEDVNKGMAAKFYYRVSDRNGNLLQDYKAASTTANAAEIKPESVVRNKIPRSVYKSAVMQWGYKSATEPFASPTTLLKGEKWTN